MDNFSKTQHYRFVLLVAAIANVAGCGREPEYLNERILASNKNCVFAVKEYLVGTGFLGDVVWKTTLKCKKKADSQYYFEEQLFTYNLIDALEVDVSSVDFGSLIINIKYCQNKGMKTVNEVKENIANVHRRFPYDTGLAIEVQEFGPPCYKLSESEKEILDIVRPQ